MGNFDTIAVRVQNGFKRVHQGAVCAGFCSDKLKLVLTISLPYWAIYIMEYRERQRGQQKMDERNRRIREDGYEPVHTKYSTIKEQLRQAVDRAVEMTKDEQDFIRIMREQFGIAVHFSRGVISYKHPDREKPIPRLRPAGRPVQVAGDGTDNRLHPGAWHWNRGQAGRSGRSGGGTIQASLRGSARDAERSDGDKRTHPLYWTIPFPWKLYSTRCLAIRRL